MSRSIDVSALLQAELSRHIEVARATCQAVSEPFAKAVELAAASLVAGGKLILFGNGGSAADAQHWAAELTVRLRANRRAIAALALTSDGAALTAIGNDFGFEHIFARQLEALAMPGDVAIGFSTSGRSPNVVAALAMARSRRCRTIAFTGRDGGAVTEHADVVVAVPSVDTARIQEINLILGHALCSALETRLGLS